MTWTGKRHCNIRFRGVGQRQGIKHAMFSSVRCSDSLSVRLTRIRRRTAFCAMGFAAHLYISSSRLNQRIRKHFPASRTELVLFLVVVAIEPKLICKTVRSILSRICQRSVSRKRRKSHDPISVSLHRNQLVVLAFSSLHGGQKWHHSFCLLNSGDIPHS